MLFQLVLLAMLLIRGIDTTNLFTEYYKMTRWEDFTIEYGHEFISANLKLEYKPDSKYHSKNTVYQENFDSDKHCWFPKDKDIQEKDFKNIYTHVVMFEKNMYLTIDFPTQTYVFDIHFNSQAFTETNLLYSEKTP